MRIFIFDNPATTEIYTVTLHDALPISPGDPTAAGEGEARPGLGVAPDLGAARPELGGARDPSVACPDLDRKSTRLNSSHANISFAGFCLTKKISLVFTYTEFLQPHR